MYPPKVVKKPPVLANYAKFANHFSIWTTGNGNLKFYSELRKIRSIPQTHTANHTKLVQFMLISKIPCSLSKTAIFTANYAKSAQFANPYSESHGISQIRAIFNYCSIFVFRHS